jgi:tetratricopeptide (TPR) repeat protein
MKRGLIYLLIASSGCAEPAPAPGAPIEASSEEKELDPLQAGRELIDHREEPGNLERALRVLDYASTQSPQSAAIHLLAAEAYSRALEDLEDRKSQERDLVRRLLAGGKPHADEAVRIEPANGAALYWRACLLLHEADVSSSLGKAKEALAQLERAESLLPGVDEGGPSRMKGRVLYELPGLFGGSLAKAIANYRKSLEVAPNCITTHLWLGEAYCDAKKYDLARKELEWVLAAERRPGHEKEDGADQKKAREKLKSLKM